MREEALPQSSFSTIRNKNSRSISYWYRIASGLQVRPAPSLVSRIPTTRTIRCVHLYLWLELWTNQAPNICTNCFCIMLPDSQLWIFLCHLVLENNKKSHFHFWTLSKCLTRIWEKDNNLLILPPNWPLQFFMTLFIPWIWKRYINHFSSLGLRLPYLLKKKKMGGGVGLDNLWESLKVTRPTTSWSLNPLYV